MQNEMWINLSSKNLKSAKDFFLKLGFKMNDRHQASHMVSMFVGSQNVVINLFEESLLRAFLGGHSTTDTSQSNEVLFSIGASSPQEVDEMAQKAVSAGGTLYGKPGYRDGWMYGCGFVDLDGHRWNILFMDTSKIPKA